VEQSRLCHYLADLLNAAARMMHRENDETQTRRGHITSTRKSEDRMRNVYSSDANQFIGALLFSVFSKVKISQAQNIWKYM